MANFEDYRTDDGKKAFLLSSASRVLSACRRGRSDSLRDAKDWAETTRARAARPTRARGRPRRYHTASPLPIWQRRSCLTPRCSSGGPLPSSLVSNRRVGGMSTARGARARLRLPADRRHARQAALRASLSPARVNRYRSAMRRCWNWGTPHQARPLGRRKSCSKRPSPKRSTSATARRGELDDVSAVMDACNGIDESLGNVVGF